MLIDTRPIARTASGPRVVQVLAEHQLLTLRHDAPMPLHRCTQRGALSRDLRALHAQGVLVLLDMTRLVRGLADELCITPERDVPGTVLLMTRMQYLRADALVHRAHEITLGLWAPASDGGWRWMPPARAHSAHDLAGAALAAADSALMRAAA
jgi:hypothetical protein